MDILDWFNDPCPPSPEEVDHAVILDALITSHSDAETKSAERLCQARQVSAATAEITRLLRSGTNPRRLEWCLYGAVLCESEDLVHVLLHAGVPWKISDIKPAVAVKSLPILSLFLEHGWNINEEESFHVPPLLACAVQKDPDEVLISWFLAHGADPNATCQTDDTPLGIAVAIAPLPIVKQLFAHCPSNTVFRGQLLHCAASRTGDDTIEVAQLVLQRCQPDLNHIRYEYDDVFSYDGLRGAGLGTALHEAARVGNIGVARLLLEKGANASKRDTRGRTALEIAEQEGHHSLARRSSSAYRDGKDVRQNWIISLNVAFPKD